MLLAVQRHPGMECTFNFVPCLLDQLDEVTKSNYEDRFTAFTRPLPGVLTPEQRHSAAKELFSVHYPTMIRPSPRYRALWEKRDAAPNPDDFSGLFSDEELLDLQMWFELAWCGPTLRSDPEIRRFFAKDRGFFQHDKDALHAKQQMIVRKILPLMHDLSTSGQIELSTSPYYHPILPLLVDTDVAKLANPAIQLPRVRFNYPADAHSQIRRAVRAHSQRFSSAPNGMWPSEGAVSDAVVTMVAEHGIGWIATDEQILWKSLPDSVSGVDWLCRPWESHGVAVLFRHRQLSDRIGFVYSQWAPNDAVDDLVQRLHEIRKQATLAAPVVTIALDGENAWEYFPDGAVGFINGLYDALTSDSRLIPTTFSNFLSQHAQDPHKSLPQIGPGSWINGNLNTWIGDRHKNAAWNLLAEVRQKFDELGLTEDEPLSPHQQEAYELLLRAEASDWFWWLGDGHTSAHDADFDHLFRSTLVQIYRLLKLPEPPTLALPIDSGNLVRTTLSIPGLAHPNIGGSYDRFYDWRGCPVLTVQQGAIHRGDARISAVQVGVGSEAVYLRLSGDQVATSWFLQHNAALVLQFLRPAAFRVQITTELAHITGGHANRDPQPPPGDACTPGPLRYAIGDALDIEIPWKFFAATPLDGDFLLEFFPEWTDEHANTDQQAESVPLSARIPQEEFVRANWIV